MKKRLTYVSPLQFGIVYATLMACVSLIFVPIFLGMTAISALAPHNPQFHQPPNPFAAMGLVFVIIIPILYAILGFVIGIIMAFIYNLIARMTGGVEFITTDVSPALATGQIVE